MILEILATFFLLVGFIMASSGKWKGDSKKFIAFNSLGSVFMCVFFVQNPNLILLALESVFVLNGIIQIFRKRRFQI